jgi:NAD(P)-dependent dehydrogenase (short-subunit alcohol dehydrogenase family)
MAERRVSIVTGASQGIGRQIALALAARGDAVALAARQTARLAEVAEQIEQAGGESLVVRTDVTDPASVQEMAASVVGRFDRIDAVVANSGIGGPSGPLWELDAQEWERTFEVNVHGVFHTARATVPAMIETGGGALVVIGSISGKRPLYGRSAYTASKLALVGLTRTLALETGRFGVRVNLISPGFVEGPRIDWVIRTQAQARGLREDAVRAEFEGLSPLGRLTSATDVAEAVLFLTSDRAGGLTGIDLNVNAGVVMY